MKFSILTVKTPITKVRAIKATKHSMLAKVNEITILLSKIKINVFRYIAVPKSS